MAKPVCTMADTDAISWSETTYTPGTLLRSYAHQLPVTVLVDKGFYGDNDTETVAVDQMARINSWVNQRRVLARDTRGRMLSIPEDYVIKMEVIGKTGKRKKAKKLKYIVRHYYLPLTVSFDRKTRWRFRVGEQLCDTESFGLIQLCRTYTVSYLRGNTIHGGIIQPSVMLLPMYVDTKMRVAEGLKTGTPEAWRDIQKVYSTSVSRVRYDKVIGEKDITVVSRGGLDTKNFAGKGVMVSNQLDSSAQHVSLTQHWSQQQQNEVKQTTVGGGTEQTVVKTVGNGQLVNGNGTPAARGGMMNGTTTSNMTTTEQHVVTHAERPLPATSGVDGVKVRVAQDPNTYHVVDTSHASSRYSQPLSVHVEGVHGRAGVVDSAGVSRVDVRAAEDRRYAHSNVERSRSLNAPVHRRMERQDYVVARPLYDQRLDNQYVSRSTGNLHTGHDRPMVYHREEPQYYRSVQNVNSMSVPAPYVTSQTTGPLPSAQPVYYREERPRRPRSYSGGTFSQGALSVGGSSVREIYRRGGLQVGLHDTSPGRVYYTTQPSTFGGSVQNVQYDTPRLVARHSSARGNVATGQRYVIVDGGAGQRVLSTRPPQWGATEHGPRVQRVGSVTVHGPGLVSSFRDRRQHSAGSSSLSSSPQRTPEDDRGVLSPDNQSWRYASRQSSMTSCQDQWAGETVHVTNPVRRDQPPPRRAREADYAVVNRAGMTKGSGPRLRVVPITLESDTDSGDSQKGSKPQQERVVSEGIIQQTPSPPPPPPPMTSAVVQQRDVNHNVVGVSASDHAHPETSVMTSSDYYTDRDGNAVARASAASYAFQTTAARDQAGNLITQQLQEQQTTTTTKTTKTTAVGRRHHTEQKTEKDARDSIRDLDNFLQSQSESDDVSQHQDSDLKDLSVQVETEVENSWL